MKPDGYPLQQVPRCTARSKRTGLPCCNHPVRGWSVCRMHGARGGTKPGRLNPAYRHGCARWSPNWLAKAAKSPLLWSGRVLSTSGAEGLCLS